MYMYMYNFVKHFQLYSILCVMYNDTLSSLCPYFILSLSLALYDQPLIVEGKRKRRSVDLFVFSSPRDTPKVKETQVSDIM